MTTTIQLDVMDLNSAAESVTFSAGIVFSGAIEPLKVEEAYARLVKAWPVLGAYVRKNQEVSSLHVCFGRLRFITQCRQTRSKQ